MAIERVVALAGGVGGAKLAFGLAKVLPPGRLTVVVNTGDDFTLYGLAISPDLDTVMYSLAGIADPQVGWGVRGDTRQMLDMMARYGERPWFQLGDRDLATHLLRTGWLSAGYTLTAVTRRLCEGLGVAQIILPMTDATVRTMVETVEYGILEFQEYFVRHRWQPVVKAIEYRGAERAELSLEVQTALERADAVVICPSNPLLSIAPLLAIPGMVEAVSEKLCLAVSPIIAGAAVKGPAAKLMAELGWSVSAQAVANYYGRLLAGFVFDRRDASRLSAADFNCRVLVTDTLMTTDHDKTRLAQEILSWVEELSS